MPLFTSVKSRIYAAFAGVTVIILVVGTMSIFMMASAGSLFGQYQFAAQQSQEINDYVRDVETLRQDLETYLGVAASFVMKTYDDEETDEKRFYDAKTIAETTRVHIENSPLIGANDDAQPSPPPAFRLN